MDLRDEARRARLMTITPAEEVCGISRQLTAKLESVVIRAVAELVSADAIEWMMKREQLGHRYTTTPRLATHLAKGLSNRRMSQTLMIIK
uniref:hypothetical protein n=1 Tax=Aeromonas veronii TaxID=654 RepID=UPI00387814B1